MNQVIIIKYYYQRYCQTKYFWDNVGTTRYHNIDFGISVIQKFVGTIALLPFKPILNYFIQLLFCNNLLFYEYKIKVCSKEFIRHIFLS